MTRRGGRSTAHGRAREGAREGPGIDARPRGEVTIDPADGVGPVATMSA